MEKRIRQALSDRFDADIAQSSDLENLGGHASLRIYWRITLPTNVEAPRGEFTLMAMVMPLGEDALKSDEGGDGKTPTELPFLNVQKYLVRLGLPVPAVEHVDMKIGVVLLEDLGQEMFENAYLTAPKQQIPLYKEAIDLLIKFQTSIQTTADHDCVAWTKEFDQKLLRWELDHYREWGLDAHYGADHVGQDLEALEGEFDRIVSALLSAPQTLVLRDYQSRNIMRKDSRWVLIDFQDALRGPFIYDLVALLRDSYIELDPSTVHELVQYYVDAGTAAGLSWCSETDVHRLFHLQTLQRKLKDAGRFIFIDQVKGNPAFLPYYKPSIAYVKNALSNLPDFEKLSLLLKKLEPAFD
jgi:aminoglycoside/choline kinase family phosphotransferase